MILQELKNKLKKHGIIVTGVRTIKKLVLRIECKIQYFNLQIYCILRKKLKKPDDRFRKINSIKDKYEGKRCFIVGNGPSVRNEDLQVLSNEVSFATNSMLKEINDGRVVYKPTYFVVADTGAYKKSVEYFNLLNDENILIGVRPIRGKVKTALDYKEICNDKHILFPTDCCDIWYEVNHKPSKTRYGFSDDASIIVRAGATTLYAIVQLAIYMGFKTIYLYGVDNNYTPQRMHFYSDDSFNCEKELADTMNDNQRKTWVAAKKFADQRNVSIFNASRGGALEVFDRVNFDSLFGKEQI